MDPEQNNMTHSEGQGIGLLLAEHYDDPATFAKLWGWTQTHLQVRQDRLLAWSWSPESGVKDHNNATDGDILVAWALARAGKRWGNRAYLEQARILAREIRLKLLHKDRRGLVLLPGVEGFEKPGYLVLNLSYWVFPAFSALQDVDPAAEWEELRDTGVQLLRESHFGRWGLPPDWIALGDSPIPAPGFSNRFGYDAVRIPLYLMWAGLDTAPMLEAFRGFWRYFNGASFIPAWTDLSDDSIDSYDAPPGIRAIAQLTLAAPGTSGIPLPALAENSTYYSAAMLLLCKFMLTDRYR